MAASIRLLVRTVPRDPRVAVNTTTINENVRRLGGRPCWTACRSACRCFCDGGAADGNTTTHFGFRSVPEAEKAQRVYKVFESVAQKYDVMNDVMSLGVHRLWKDTLLRAMNPQPGQRLLDVAGGTGDIAFRFLDYVSSRPERRRTALRSTQTDPSRQQGISSEYLCASEERAGAREPGQEPSRAVVCDINKEMLNVGKRKADSLGITGNASGLSWVVGDAEELPFDDDQFDLYTVAFGIRNVTHVDRALREALRVLKPGGRCLEFSKVTNPLLARLYDVYSFQMIPVLGEVIAGDWKSYQYLVESIRRFPDQETFKCMIEDAGFYRVQYRNLTGGVVALHSGFKL